MNPLKTSGKKRKLESKKSGAQFAQQKKRKLLEVAGNACNQKRLIDCFKSTTNVDNENENNHSSESGDDTEASSQCCNPTMLINKHENTEPECLNTITMEESHQHSVLTEVSVEEIDSDNTPVEEISPVEETTPVEETSSVDFDYTSVEAATPFQIPQRNTAAICSFLKLHPIQPSSCNSSSLFARDFNGSKIHRSWLSYNIDDNKFYCSICMSFSDTSNYFKIGVSLTSKHRSTRIHEHEKSDVHLASVNAYIRYDRNKNIEDLIKNEQSQLRLSNVRKNRELLKRIINWILCVGRQGIGYRGSSESTKYFDDESVNHGNLLEILKTASQEDEVLKQHFDKCSKPSVQPIITDERGPKGRGSKVTFLSKTTFNKIINAIGEKMKKFIVNNMKTVGMYALIVDGTQDISGHEQVSIIVRYVDRHKNTVEEKMIGLLRLVDASGQGYLNAIIDYLKKLTIDSVKMIGGSFDGAGSMRSDEKGLQARLKIVNPDFIYTWCYAHSLNLSISESVSCVMSAKNLFGLLQRTHTFCSESYKRVLEWEKSTSNLKGREKLIRFEHLGKTRWYSKDKALSKIFGSFSEIKANIFMSLITFLYNIKMSDSFGSEASFEAGALLENWTKMETILTAFVFLKIFQILGPLSKYLQTDGLDIMAALTMTESAISRIAEVRDMFETIKTKAVLFAKEINNSIEARNEKTDDIKHKINVIVEEEIPNRRIRKVKRMPGEIARDEPIEDAWKNYRVNQFLVICDTTTESLKNRFANEENKPLLTEISYFHPRKFEDVVKLDRLNLSFISKMLNIDESSLVQELNDFAHNFATFRKLDDTTYSTQNLESNDKRNSDIDYEEVDYDDDCETKKCVSSKKSCNKCLKCCFQLLSKINLHTSAYSNLYLAYEYIVTLPCTQVACERSFSKLKIIKSRLRSSLKQYLLEPLLLMSVERELTFKLDVTEIVNLIGNSSIELKRLLIE